MKIGLISDTHGYLDDRILHHLSSCDEIWHAGDIGDIRVTDALSELKPLRAVYGNIDDHTIRAEFPLNHNFELEKFTVWMTHIGGKPGRYAKGILDEMYTNKPDIFICGHSHICKVEMDKKRNCLYLNPGAAGVHGFHKVRTLLRFDIHNKKIENLEVVELGNRDSTKNIISLKEAK